MVEIKRKVTKEVEEVVKMELKPFWNINVVQGALSLKVIARSEFMYEPTEQEIADVLARYIDKKNVYASVVKNYKLCECDADLDKRVEEG